MSLDKKDIIIIILIVFIISLITCVVLITHAAETQISSNASNTLQNGDNFTIILKDKNNKPIAYKLINLTIINSNGEKNQINLTTDEKGEATITLNGLTEDTYTFAYSFKGDFDYKKSFNQQNITIKSITQESYSSDDNTITIDPESYRYATWEGYDKYGNHYAWFDGKWERI